MSVNKGLFLWGSGAALAMLVFVPAAFARQSGPLPVSVPASGGLYEIMSAGAITTTTPLPSTPTVSQGTPSPGPGATFADPAFKRTWSRTDELVSDGRVSRSWYWGPQPNTGPLQEDYAEGPGGKHLVQYFDKSRMEINNPNGNKNDPFYVTNGLLAQEMVTGKMQVGNTQFIDRYSPQIPLASDTDDPNAPTYASFRDVRRNASTNRVNAAVNTRIDREGFTAVDTQFDQYAVKNAYFEAATQHNIPDVFWAFLNESGPVVVSETVRHARLNDPYFYATGYPITEAYWARVKIANKPDTAVLVQAYQRRVLTYVPSASGAFKVQVGNIGQHYYDWRYKDAGLQESVPLACGNFLSRTAGIGKLWYDNAAVRRQLGCPQDEGGRQITIAQQAFQRGQMLDIILPGAAGAVQKTIYVLHNDGSAQRFPDTYVDGSPEPTPAATPPVGFLTPLRGFGKVWNENAQVRERLGWAASGEQASPTAFYMAFERGIAAGPNPREMYVVYDDKGMMAANANRWLVYPTP